MSSLGSQSVEKSIRNVLRKYSTASILTDRAKMRIRNQGDSTVKYPELWANREQVGYRKNGKALRDTGLLMMLLSVEVEAGSDIKWTLTDGTGYGVKHQEGFINQGPIAVALSPKAKGIIKAMGEPPHDILALDQAGLEEAPDLESAQNPRKGNLKYDYYIIEGNPKVPARPIANNPPEDIRAITAHIKRAIKGIK